MAKHAKYIKCPNCTKKILNESGFCRFCGNMVHKVHIDRAEAQRHPPIEYLSTCLISGFFGGIVGGLLGLLISWLVYGSGVFGLWISHKHLHRVDLYGRVQYLEAFIIGSVAGAWGGILYEILTIVINPARIHYFAHPFGIEGMGFAFILPPMVVTFLSLYLTLIALTLIQRFDL